MYMLVRLIVASFVGVGLIFSIKRSGVIRKKLWYIVSACGLVVLVVGMAFFPFENHLFTFKSPEAAYAYYSNPRSEVDLVVKGDFCDFVVDRNGTVDTYLIVPKTIDGWKIGIGSDMRERAQAFDKGVSVQLFQYKNTDDYFITVLDASGGESEISMNDDVTFYSLTSQDSYTKKTYVTYFAHISDFTSPCEVIVNGRQVLLKIS